MRYHNITKDDMLNGDGLRVVLWVAGCTHHCPDCQNPITWDINGGIPYDAAAEAELAEALSKPYISGITFSGGDPLHPENRREVFEIMARLHAKFPHKTIWLYTGFLWEEICTIPELSMVDVLVDGRFDKTLKDVKLHWIGSSNQRVIDVKETLKSGKLVLHK